MEIIEFNWTRWGAIQLLDGAEAPNLVMPRPIFLRNYTETDMPFLLPQQDFYPVKVPGIRGDFNDGIEHIQPLQDPDLWLKFAKKDPKQVDILKFAKKYGTLYSDHPKSNYIDGEEYLVVERIIDWKIEMQMLNLGFEIWENLTSGDIERAKNLLPRRYNKNLSWNALRGSGILYFGFSTGYSFEKELEEQISEMSEETLWVMLTELIEERMVPTSLGLAGGGIYNMERKKREFAIRPQYLASALWNQFAQAVASGAIHSKCQNPKCGRLFAVGVTPSVVDGKARKKSHADRMYCSKACKQQAWREKRKSA